MILQELTRYYDTLVKEEKVSAPGWEDSCKVNYGLNLDDQGKVTLIFPYDRIDKQGKKEKRIDNQLMRVPVHVKRTSGIAANFLCDSPSYILGIDEKEDYIKAKKCFLASKNLHQKILAKTESPAAKAVLAFFEKWQPKEASANLPTDIDLKNIVSSGNLIFCYEKKPVSDDRAIADAWQEYYDSLSSDKEQGICLVTGRKDAIARTHPAIKGVRGTQPSGANLVSFNAEAFESYGHKQGDNAPVGQYAATAYTTALNYLLADKDHCQVIGDTTVVCWAQHGQKVYQDMGMMALFGTSNQLTDADLSAALHKLSRGEYFEWDGISLDPDENFYILGLAPNVSRLSVRFFSKNSFKDFMKNIQQHYEDIKIVGPSYDECEYIPLWQLLNETVNQKSRNKDASPQMAGNVLEAILTNTPYPASLLNGVELRIRAERDITRGRAAIIKAYYLRMLRRNNTGTYFPKEVLQMELNKNSTDVAYTLGRMFSVYEQIQKKANPNVNTTIKDKYFNSAAATPSMIFPVLGNLAAKHLRIVGKTNKGAAVNLEKELGSLSTIIGNAYPTRLNLPEQGSFQLGYYFENQAQYQKKEDKENV